MEVNGTWLITSELANQRAREVLFTCVLLCAIHLPAAEEKQNGSYRYIVTNKVTLWSAGYSACMVYT